ncbi:cysteine hydrolase family protein [Senegalia massiliensis]
MSETAKKYVSFYYENGGGMNKIKINPQKTALLIVDMQNHFVRTDFGEALDYKADGEWERWLPFYTRLHDIVIPNTQKLIESLRKNKIEVTHGRIASLKKDGSDRCLVQRKPGWNDILLPVNSENAQIIDELKPLDDEIVVNKTTDSVVAGTNYTSLIRNMGIETIIVTGIVTDQCVASTVRDLADEGFEVIVVEDCCAAADHRLHENELEIMNVIYCSIMNTDEVIDLVEKSLK